MKGRRTYPKWTHGSPLGIYLIDICESSGECIGGDLVAVFISEVSGFCTGAGNLGTSVGYVNYGGCELGQNRV